MFNTHFQNKPVTIVSLDQLGHTDSHTALVRLENGKLALMTRSRECTDRWEPFFPMGMETGFWDTRCYPDTDYDRAFENYRKLGSNACWFMLHWSDVEPERDRFDFGFADSIVNAARKYEIKICWVFFTHAHCNDRCLHKDDFWAYRLDSHDGKDFAVQWLKDDKGIVYDSIERLNTVDQMEIFPCYSHPVLFERIQRVIREMARHYRHSDTVMGIQIGNEEGFLQAPLKKGYDSDYNPYTLRLFKEWQGSGRSSWPSFKQWMVKWWWRHFTTAFHEEDPYKLTTFNLWAGYPEKGWPEAVFRTGTDMTTYGEGNIDAVGTMFYDKDCDPVWENLDRHYDCVCSLPIFIPSEIGLGIHSTNNTALSREFVIKTLARGAQGFDIYAYGHFFDRDQGMNHFGEALKGWNSMISSCIDTVWSGLPGCDGIELKARGTEAAVHCLTGLDGTVVGMLHFPGIWQREESGDACVTDLEILLQAAVPGEYDVVVFRDGQVLRSERASLAASSATVLHLEETPRNSLSFIKISKVQ